MKIIVDDPSGLEIIKQERVTPCMLRLKNSKENLE